MVEQQEPHLRIYQDRSVLVVADGSTETFWEGPPDEETKRRHSKIDKVLHDGYLTDLFEGLRKQAIAPAVLDSEQMAILEQLVNSITGQAGRAIVGLVVLLLAIKDIEPEQSIRLHKGGRGEFSWSSGLPMRVLDSKYNTPALRQFDLLRLNNYGIFMTRSLAENYPYSKFYKASIKGAKEDCFALIDLVETGKVQARPTLEVLISMLINRSDRVTELGERTLASVDAMLRTHPQPSDIKAIIGEHVRESTYGARLLEVAMHSLLQVFHQRSFLEPNHLKALSQMRSANKKHGNVADIEIVSEVVTGSHVLEAWDAKYGKPYLRDELEELNDKLELHPETLEAGFVVDRQPEIDDGILERIEEIELLQDVTIRILEFDEWVSNQIARFDISESTLMSEYLVAYAETLALRRPQMAPIDEPADRWLEDLLKLLDSR